MEKGEEYSTSRESEHEDRRIGSSHGIKGRGGHNKVKNQLLQPDSHFRNMSELNVVVLKIHMNLV